MERTLAFIKPDAVGVPWTHHVMKEDEENEGQYINVEEELSPDKAEAIRQRILDAGFTIADEKRVRLSKAQAKAFYAEHKSRPFFEDLTDFLSSGPVILMVLEKEGAVAAWRELLGPTNPEQARRESEQVNPLDMHKWSIRAAFGSDPFDGSRNAAHGSDSIYSARREIAFFFPTAPSLQKTLAIVKPDVLKAGKSAAVMAQIAESGFVVIAQKEETITKERAEEFYAAHSTQDYFPHLVADMVSGPSMVLILERMDAIHSWRMMMGPGDVPKARTAFPHTIRARHSTDAEHPVGGMCTVHGSVDAHAAASEIAFWFPDPVPTEWTLAMIKPHAVAAGHTNAIVRDIGLHGFTVVAQERVQLTKERAGVFYAEHRGRAFFPALCDMMSSGPMVALVLSKHAAIKGWRALAGPTNSSRARQQAPGSLRARFGVDGQQNAVHGSDSTESAARETKFFFPRLVPPGPVKTGAEAQAYLGELLAAPTKTLNEVLGDGLVELCKVKPTGLAAVKWLGEWLLANNPSQPMVDGGAAGAAGAPRGASSASFEYTDYEVAVVEEPHGNAGTLAGASKAGMPNQGAVIELPEEDPLKVVFVLGGPGSGKGTQCSLIKERFGYVHLSTGDLLRAEVESGSAQGKEIEAIMAQGGLVQLETVLGLLRTAIQVSPERKFLVDGFPRELPQAFAFEHSIGVPAFVLFFDAPDDVLTERLIMRGQSSGRVDDNEEAIKKRLALFHDHSAPVADFYGKLGKVRMINADRKKEDIFKDVCQCFHPQAVVVLGGPGSGKGAQCELIAQEFGYVHLSPGDLLRQEVEAGTPVGVQVERLLKQGQLVPDEIILQVLKKGIEGASSPKVLLDGFPRTMEQAEAFEREVCPCSFVLHLDCNEKTMRQRCINSGRGRADDTPVAVARRMKTYKDKTVPVVDLYQKAALVRTVDSNSSVEQVFADVRRAFAPKVVFVLGGPGSGKGTQCARIVQEFGYTHLSAGDLLRAEVARGSPQGHMIDTMIRQGQIVPVEVTLSLLKQAMAASSNDKFLIDGFPRAIDQATAFEEQVGPCSFTLFLECTEETMRARLLERGKTSGRVDDNEAAIVKRFRVFEMQSMPVINYFSRKGRVKMVKSHAVEDGHVLTPDEVYEEVRACFAPNTVFVLGGPGSGKGTQCSRIAQEFGYTHLSTGDLLRAEVARGSPDGQGIQDMMASGKIVPVDVTLALLKRAMDKNHASNNFLIDGYPRAIDQAVAYEEQIGPCNFTLFLDCPEEAMRARLLERGKTSGRADDNEAAIVKRFQTYVEQSKPVIDRYQEAGLVREVSSVGTADAVFDSLRGHFQPNVLLVAIPEFPQKDTLMTRLCKELGCARLDTVALLDDEVARGTADGQAISDAYARGRALTPALVLRVLNAAVLESPSTKFLLDGYPRVQMDGFPLINDQIFAMDKGFAKCRMLLHVDVKTDSETRVAQGIDPEAFSAFQMESGPLVRFFHSLGRIKTVTVDESVADFDYEAIYQEMRQVAAPFLASAGVAAYETGRQLENEYLEECRRKCVQDAIDKEAPPAEEEDE